MLKPRARPVLALVFAASVACGRIGYELTDTERFGRDAGSGGRADTPSSGAGGRGASAGSGGANSLSGDAAVAGNAGSSDAAALPEAETDAVHGSFDAASDTPLNVSPTPNLIVNGDAEADPGYSAGQPGAISITGWSRTGGATPILYGAPSYPTSAEGPPNPGNNFFGGGANDASSSLTQLIDVSAYGAYIDGTSMSFQLDVDIGGFAGQDDSAVVTLTFQDAADSTLDARSTTPVTPAERSQVSGFIHRQITGAVPISTRKILVQIVMTRARGSTNDGYADNLTLTMTAN